MKGFTGKIGLFLVIITLFAGLISGCSAAVSTTPVSTTTVPTSISPTPTVTTPAASPTLTPSKTPEPTSISITDDYGRTVKINKYPQRIISLSPANTEILFALGLGDRVVGVSDYSDYPEAAKTKESVGAYDTPNIEKIVSLEPDLVLATEEHQQAIEQMDSKGITAIAINPKTVAQVLSTINLIGHITGKDSEAATLVAGIQKRIDAVTAKTAALTAEEKPRVFVVIWHNPIYTVGSGTFHDELIRMAGGVNIAGDLSGYPTISLETVIADNPQIIIAGVGMGEGESLSLQFMQTDSRLKNTDARLNNWVYGANMDIVSRPGPRLADALETFFSLIHPELK